MYSLSINSKKKTLIAFSLLLIAVLIAGPIKSAVANLLTPNNQPNAGFVMADGPVNASAVAPDGTVYFGGDFTYLGSYTGGGVQFAASTGQLYSSFPKINGPVNAAVADGSGGWYIGGDFTKVGSVSRTRLAHITSDGKVNPNWRPSADGVVMAMALNSTKTILYIGGDFGLVNGKTRNYAASVSVKPLYDKYGKIIDNYAILQSWNPNPDDTVKAMAVNSTNVYIGGSFTMVGSNYRNNIAAISTSGTPRIWNPDLNDEVNAITVVGTTVYIGGNFTEFFTSGLVPTTMNYLAAVSTAVDKVVLRTWYPEPDDTVNDIAVYNGNVYVGGEFTQIGTPTSDPGNPYRKDRNYLGAVSATTGHVTSWSPNTNGIVKDLAVSDQGIFVGGEFTKVGLTKDPVTKNWVGGVDRRYLAAFDTAGPLKSWTAHANDAVAKVVLDGTKLFVGGDFNSIRGSLRNRLAAVSPTGALLSWNPGTDGAVNALALDGSNNIYIGGSFTTVKSNSRSNLAAVSASGSLLSWNPNANGAVKAIAVDGSKVYIGGAFTTVNSVARNNLAAVTAGVLDPSWSPNPNNTVNAIAVDANKNVYIGGAFTSVGQPRNRLAKYNSSGTLNVDWKPGVNGTVNALAVSGSTLYVGGNFLTVAGQSRNMLAAVSTSGSGTPTSWNPGANYMVKAIAIDGSNIYVGGNFTRVAGLTRNRLALIGNNGVVKGWNPSLNSGTSTLVKSAKFIFAGGTFTKVSGTDREYLAKIDFDITAPVLKFASNAKPQGSHVKGKITVPMTASDAGTGVSKVEVYYGTTRLGVKSVSPYNLTVDTTKVPNGKRTFIIKAFDKAGNSSKISRYYIVDNVLPLVNSASLSPLSPWAGTYATVYYKVSDNLAPYVFVTLQIRKGTSTVRSLNLGKKTKGIINKQSVKMPGTAGAYVLRVIATDYAGNKRIKDTSFTVK